MNAKLDPKLIQVGMYTLGKINSLLSQAGDQPDLTALGFVILNETASLIPYDRAFLFDRNARKLLGVSGSASPDTHSQLAKSWKLLLSHLADKSTMKILNPTDFPTDSSYNQYAAENGGTTIIFLPLIYNDEIQALLCLERWQAQQWEESNLAFLKTLCRGYGQFWYWIGKKSPSISYLLKSIFTPLRLLIVGIVIIALLFIPFPMRIAAPCEIIPDKPTSITTRINGVINRILVEPGDEVIAGDELVLFDKKVIFEELKEAKQQVAEYEEKFLRSQSKVFDSPHIKGELAILRAQLEQSKARHSLTEYYAEQSTIIAPVSGSVLMGDPDEWEGKPVRVGERLMLLFNPKSSKLRIELPQDDKVDFPAEAKVNVILSSISTSANHATLTYVANHAQISPDGRSFFLAEAEWQEDNPPNRMGLRGTAIIYGEKVPLGYLIFRKPIAWLRNSIGW